MTTSKEIISNINDQNQPDSIGPTEVTVIFWPFERMSACKTRPTSRGSGAYASLLAPEEVAIKWIKITIKKNKSKDWRHKINFSSAHFIDKCKECR